MQLSSLKIAIVGHSNAAGLAIVDPGPPPIVAPRRRPWAEHLRHVAGAGTRVVNLGRGGARITDWLPAGQYHDLLSEPGVHQGFVAEGVPGAEVVIVQLAEAEALCPADPGPPAVYADPAEVLADAEALVCEIESLAPGAAIVWLGPIAIRSGNPQSDAELQQRLMAIDDELAAGLSVPYVQLYPAFVAAQGISPDVLLLDPDGIENVADPWHLTELGHAFVVDRALQGIESL